MERSPEARLALLGLCRQLGFEHEHEMWYGTQALIENAGRPDLLGRTRDGVAQIALEAKFWAGLTEYQPAAYLQALPSGGLVLFVAPATRLPSLWHELLVRSAPVGDITHPGTQLGDLHGIRVGTQLLGLVSWRVLLAHLHAAVAANNADIAADIRQLESLCAQMDSEAFLPLRSEDLTGDLGRRLLQYYAIAEDLASLAARARSAEIALGGPCRGIGEYGRYFTARGRGLLVLFDARNWATHGCSPVWLAVYGPDTKACTVEPDYLRAAGIEFHMDRGHCMVALRLAEGVERDSVLQDALAQILRVVNALPLPA